MIFSPFERLVAMRYLRARRQEGLISVITCFSLIGIALGVMTLITVMSVMNGFREDMFSRVIGLNGHMHIYATGGNIENYQSLLDRVRKAPEVADIAPVVEAQALITREGSASGAFVRGVPPDTLRGRPTIANHIDYGSLADFKDNNIAIGIRMAQRLNLNLGDTLTLISPVSKTTVFGATPRMRGYKIVAIFDVGMTDYDNNFVFMPLEAAQVFFSTGNDVTALEIFVRDPHNLKDARIDVVNAIGTEQQQPLRVLDWQQTNSSFYTAIQVERNVMFLILTLIILVATFNIISSLIMLVKDKSGDIAVLRTMGATKGMIMRIFFLNGACIGMFGTGLGLVLGLLLAKNIEQVRQIVQRLTRVDPFSPDVYFLTHMPSIIDPYDIIHIITMSLTLSFLGTLYPSWRAAKMDPVEALRYE